MKLATLCYVKAHGRTLMMHRIKKANDMHEGKWNGLGGKLMPGETPEQCAIREVEEESGLRMVEPQLRGFLTFPAFDEIDDWYVFVFVAYGFTGELIDSSEGVLAWVDDDRLLDLNLWEGDRVFLQWLERDGIFSGQFIYEQGRLVDHHVIFYDSTPAPRQNPAPKPQPPTRAPYRPVYDPADDTYCWTCGGAVVKRHCKIVCQVCGFTRDCSDP
ncbi:MAG: 8-oxo-dGTP diphosphatase [Caldilineaceae bacterium]|nr:8-oxo-dGTP diphosphatase [Caldilineaceae bacterium]